MAKFTDRLKTLRAEAGLSQSELAKQVGTTKSSINMYERGEREPGIERLETIADYFNVDMDYLLGKSDVRNKTAYLLGLNDFEELMKLKKAKAPTVDGEDFTNEDIISAYLDAPEHVKEAIRALLKL